MSIKAKITTVLRACVLAVVIYFRRLWSCYLWRFHDWTCAAAEGIPATPEQLTNGIEGFYDYAKMYCKQCGKESQISRLERERAKHE